MLTRDQDQGMLDREKSQSSKPKQNSPGLLRYEVLDEGSDARMLSGKWSGSLISELINTSKGRPYLGWIFTLEGVDDLKLVIERVFDED